MSGYAIIEITERENTKITQKGKLPSNWSAQCCEIYALKRELDLSEEIKEQFTLTRDTLLELFILLERFGGV